MADQVEKLGVGLTFENNNESDVCLTLDKLLRQPSQKKNDSLIKSFKNFYTVEKMFDVFFNRENKKHVLVSDKVPIIMHKLDQLISKHTPGK